MGEARSSRYARTRDLGLLLRCANRISNRLVVTALYPLVLKVLVRDSVGSSEFRVTVEIPL